MKREELEVEIKAMQVILNGLKSSDLYVCVKGLKKELKQLKKQLEELPKLEVVGWYAHDVHPNWMMYFDGGYRYGIEINGTWNDDFSGNSSLDEGDRPATDKEVQTALIEEAKKRGFKEGVRVDSFESKTCYEHLNSIIDKYDGRTINLRLDGALCFGNKCVFLDGKWAIIKDKTIHLKEGDYTEAQLKDSLIILSK